MADPNHSPTVAVMIGDPAGIGPEISTKAAVAIHEQGIADVVLVGSAGVVGSVVDREGLALGVRAIDSVAAAKFEPGQVEVLDHGCLPDGVGVVGQPSAAGGRAVRAWIRQLDELLVSETVQAGVLAPVSTEALRMAGAIVEDNDLQPPDTFLLRLSGALRVVSMTEHIPLRDVPRSITTAALAQLVRLANDSLQMWGIPQPRIAVAGLNPHAQGAEEVDVIGPAVAQVRADGVDVSGPLVPDTVFRHCIDGRHDLVVAMYHDQCHVALKTAAFFGACTVFLGFPGVRLSVPHGTAFDIAGTGRADPASLLSSISVAARLGSGRGLAATDA